MHRFHLVTVFNDETDMNHQSASDQTFNRTVLIDAPASTVWEALTNPASMKKWMSDTEIEILTDWTVGSPFLIRGRLHGIKFENKGKVLGFEAGKLLRYSHLSSLSRLPDQDESYSVFEFRLTPIDQQTSLTLTLSNFPTESIYKHLVFYWSVTLEMIKKMIEKPEEPLRS